MSHAVRHFEAQSYFVSSATQADTEHLVDLSEEHPQCSCQFGLDYKPEHETRMCRHIEAAISFRSGVRIERKPGDSPFLLMQLRTTEE